MRYQGGTSSSPVRPDPPIKAPTPVELIEYHPLFSLPSLDLDPVPDRTLVFGGDARSHCGRGSQVLLSRTTGPSVPAGSHMDCRIL